MEFNHRILPHPPPFQLTGDQSGITPIVFASPHSGRHYPEDLLQAAALDSTSLRKSEDAFVDRLLASATAHGIPLVAATHARAYIDLNREPYELDQSMFEDQLPAYASMKTARVAAGLGSIARVVAEGQEIYSRKLFFADARNRIERVHRPYHHALHKLVRGARDRHGIALLVDWHSMPSAAKDPGQRSPDIVLGDRFGTSCENDIVNFVSEKLCDRGYVVTRNAPFAGGYTTEYYGQPTTGIHALQIEINRRLYLDEATLEPHSGFHTLAANLRFLIQELPSIDWQSFSTSHSRQSGQDNCLSGSRHGNRI